MTQPLAGVKVLDFSTLLPGPLCSLLLAEAGADVIKLERPDLGDEMRTYDPKLGEDSANFVLLNRGKQSIAIDLKSESALAQLTPAIEEADILIEQFRPGVMERLGLGYTALAQTNPRLIYCSITGFGQRGARSREAAHDLNYVAATGMLALTSGGDGAPSLPPALIADIAGGAYPAMINILLALMQRERTGRGLHIDVAMADNLFTLQYWGLASGALGVWPGTGTNLVTGGSPRYQIYRTADDAFLAAAPLEDKFWEAFVGIIGLDVSTLSRMPPSAAVEAIATAIAAHTAAYWEDRFAGRDVCVTRVVDLRDALHTAHFQERGLFKYAVVAPDGTEVSALPVPLNEEFRHACRVRRAPVLGEHNSLLERHSAS
ncbi:CaiB/BaiF CoA transferase family protein [Bordetella genomosp. 11]|uniref:CoA transferase n=1 Tax=Bordetella genomosp. 11 TaxID=1416808 RepID=A0A261UJJ7_9BORD|nr:CaiB/BaiF CoA-transferase family protein [Bordetella genomosp. 11]OZI61811.1 CoA transferase [Bordetella genomosp. 11]